jgi:hypothetical protein
MLARDNNKKRQRGQPLEANTSLCEQAPKICSVEARLADNVDADAWAKAFVSASTIASMLVGGSHEPVAHRPFFLESSVLSI